MNQGEKGMLTIYVQILENHQKNAFLVTWEQAKNIRNVNITIMNGRFLVRNKFVGLAPPIISGWFSDLPKFKERDNVQKLESKNSYLLQAFSEFAPTKKFLKEKLLAAV